MSFTTAVPVLDISGFLADEDGPAGQAFVDEFRATVHRTSFLVLDGHGFDSVTNRFVKVVRCHPARSEYPGSWGVGEHTDGTLFAIVHQDEVGGLQELIDGEWVDVPVRPAALGINVGTTLQYLTDGYYRHVWHRVAPPPTDAYRYSVCYFPSISAATLAPLPVPEHLLADVAPEDRTDPTSPLVTEERFHQGLLRSIRSHPNVGARHYPDLLAEAGVT